MKYFIVALVVTLAVCADALKFRNSPIARVEDTVESYGLDEFVWDGYDDPAGDASMPVSHSALPQLNLSDFSYHSKGDPAGTNSSRPPVNIMVLGLFNSGTNLVNELLKLNFQGQVLGGAAMWKHASLRNFVQDSPNVRAAFGNFIGVAVIRDLLSWLQSMRKAPYDLQACALSKDWLTTRCTIPEQCGAHSSNCKQPAHRTPVYFMNIEEYWNHNTQDYQHLSKFGFFNVFVVRYEDVVLNTERVVSEFARIAGLSAPVPIRQLNSPAKKHGASGGRAAAIAKLKRKDYLSMYRLGEQRKACDRLDTSLMRQMGYHDCESVARTPVG